MITIFTPTYNRAHLLPALYESLKQQTLKQFEWLVVDDGSRDNTAQVVADFQKDDCGFAIRYIAKPNGGKHTAINLGAREANGQLFLILDSDDSLPRDAVATILEEYDKVKDTPWIGGVCGLMAHHNGERIGSGLPHDVMDIDEISLRHRWHVTGDLLEVFTTEVMREFPFPEIEGERFCPEQLVWFRIAQKYKLHCFNKVIYLRDYLEGGLTDHIVKIRMESPVASCMTYSEMLNYDIPLMQKVKAAINYWRFYQHPRCHGVKVAWCWHLLRPLGLAMQMRDKKAVTATKQQ